MNFGRQRDTRARSAAPSIGYYALTQALRAGSVTRYLPQNSEKQTMDKSKRRGAGEGLIRLRSDGRWEARLSLGWEGGKRKRKSYFGASQGEVKDKLLAARSDHSRGLLISAKAQTLGAFLDDWLLRSLKPRAKARAFESFSSITRLHIKPTLGNVPLHKLSPQHISRLLHEKTTAGLSPQSD